MKKPTQTTTGINTIVWKENDLFVAKALEVEVTSQGKTSKEALKNLEEALELFFENENISAKTINPLKYLKLHKINLQVPQYA